jgi:integrative and conjugative element protein (TIGR02256 family)
MSDLEFWSEDHRFGLKVAEREVSRIRKMCATASTQETGGILVGVYTKTHDCAVVTAVSGAPPDSKSGRNWFFRGVRGLQEWLVRLWHTSRHYYLGEWHYHPGGPPHPSPTDNEQMRRVANSILYQCPEPILLVVGSGLASERDMKAFVFPRGKGSVELIGKEQSASK